MKYGLVFTSNLTRLAIAVGFSLLSPAMMVAAQTALAGAPAGGTTTPKPITAALSPASVTFAEASEQETRDASLVWQVDPADVAGPIAIAAPADLPGGLKLAIDRLGAPSIDRDRAGQPTGAVRQRVRLRFTAIPRRLDSQSIALAVSLGKVERSVEITVTNLSTPPTGASLTVAVPVDLRWSADKPIGLVLSAQGAAAPGVVLAAGPFVETQSKRSAPIDLCLRTAPQGQCVDDISIAANRPLNLFLASRSQADLEPGAYTGTLRFLAGNGLKADQTIQLEVTSDWWRRAGMIALVLGTVLSFLLSVLFPYWRDREFALRPFVILKDRLDAARESRRKLATPNLDGLSAKIERTLTPKWLVAQGLIGRRLPSFAGPPDVTALKAHLDAQAKWSVTIERLTSAALSRPDVLDKIDAIAVAPDLTPENVDAKINAAIGAPNLRRLQEESGSLTLADIAFREDVRNGIAWILSSLLSVALGYVILIDNDPSFGGWTDLAGALLWALGLSVAGGKIAEVTSGQLRGVLRPPKAT